MSVSGQLKEVFIPIIEEWWSTRHLGALPLGNDNDRLGSGIANLLELPNLPEDIREALSNHLTGMFGDKRILIPEWCRRLYPLLVELNKSTASHDASQAVEPEKTEESVITNQISFQDEDQPITHTINGEASDPDTAFQDASHF